MRAPGIAIVASCLAVAVAAAQDVRRATPISPSSASCTRPACRVTWSRAIGGRWHARLRQTEERGGRESIITLVLSRGGASWEQEIERSGIFCGGRSEFARAASVHEVRLRDFAGGPLPEIFVDYHVTVVGVGGPDGEGGSASQSQTIVCSVEGAVPSCLGSYVAGAPRTYPARGTIAVGGHAFDVVFP